MPIAVRSRSAGGNVPLASFDELLGGIPHLNNGDIGRRRRRFWQDCADRRHVRLLSQDAVVECLPILIAVSLGSSS
jgi:hypothetical protein